VNGLPEGKAGKTLALGLCVIAMGVVYVAAIAPLLALYADGAQHLQERLAFADRLDASVHDLERLRAVAAQWKEKASAADVTFPAASDAVTAATLQSTMQGFITDGGGVLSSAEILPPQAGGSFQRVGIRVSFTGSLRVLTTVLENTERARPAIFVDNLDVHIAGQGTSADASQALAITFDAYGFLASS
jgi:general secretion pathway protein M